MGLRAELERTQDRRAGAPAARALRAFALVLPLLLLFSATPLTAQQSARGQAVIHIPMVSHLDVEPVSTTRASTPGEHTGTLRVRVRANHQWKVVVAVPAGTADPVWVRVADDGALQAYQRIDPGSEVVIATGGGGATEMRVDYRWEGDDGGSDMLPVQATLAAASL